MTSGVWYVAYGSNMAAARLACYLEGGCPPGGSRVNPGARDCTLPARSEPVDLPGTTYFAGESRQWGGGVAFYDHDEPGRTAARAFLVTPGQLADIAAQEMYRLPAAGDPLEELVLDLFERHSLGPGRYETLVCVGDLDGHPLLTFTCPHGARAVEHTRPVPAYLSTMATGLRESREWSNADVQAYLDTLITG
ncbi:MAG: histone deacetylase [Mycobacteriales bacterium]